MKRRQLANGSAIFAAGDRAESFFILMAGSVVFEPADTRPGATAQEPVFGLSDALLGRPRSYTAMASSDCILLEVTCTAEKIAVLAGTHQKLLSALGKHFSYLAGRRLQDLNAASKRER